MAQQRGVEEVVVKAAMDDADTVSARVLLIQIQQVPDGQFLISKYCEQLLRAAKQKGNLVDFAPILLEIPNDWVAALATAMCEYKDERVIPLLRQIIFLSWSSFYTRKTASLYIIRHKYDDDLITALEDSFEFVCKVAITELETQGNTEGMIKALSNRYASVRQPAAWYMGRQEVKAAIEPLIELIRSESDVETLRAAIWSLGVLRANQVLPYLHALSFHTDPLIATTAQESISRIEIDSYE